MRERLEIREHIERIVREVWAAIPQVPIAVSAEGKLCSPLRVCIETRGEWRGTLILEVEEPLARFVASAMFGLSSGSEVSALQLADATRELANMLGGNLKSVLPFKCQLGLPALTINQEPADCAQGPSVFLRVDFESEGNRLCVHLLKEQDEVVDVESIETPT